MARRVAGMVTAIGCWSIGTVLLAGAAAFLFAAALHPTGSDGWVIAAAGAVVLALGGTGFVSIGWWFASRRSVSHTGYGVHPHCPSSDPRSSQQRGPPCAVK